MKTAAMIQRKGGVGKTTLAVNFAAYAAQAGMRVLLVDLDPQASASHHLEAEPADDRPGLADVIDGRGDLLDAAARVPAMRRLTLVPADARLAEWGRSDDPCSAEETRRLHDAVQRTRGRWSRAMRPSGGKPDLLVFDTPPGWGPLTVNVLVASQSVIVPVEPRPLSLVGLVSLLGLIRSVRQDRNPVLDLAAVAPLRFQEDRLSHECLNDLRDTFGGQVLPPVRECAEIAEAPRRRLPVCLSAPGSRADRELRSVAQLLLQKLA